MQGVDEIDRLKKELAEANKRADEAEALRDAAMDNARLMNAAAERYLRRAEAAEAAKLKELKL